MNINGPLNLVGMIGRLNRTLSFAGQIIPLYQKAKPMIANAKSAFLVAKNLMQKEPKEQKAPVKKIENKPTNIKKVSPTNKPTFFL